MASKTVFLLSISADIGRALAAMYADDGLIVVGTYRQRSGLESLEERRNVHLLPCDVSSPPSVETMAREYKALNLPWDVFISAVGSLDPVGPWASLDFDVWERSVIVNSTAQLRVLHALYPHRRPDGQVHAAFFAGGGTNGPFSNYSAYCVSKILLIKMCELLDDEVPDLNAFIIGPGFLPTKIHRPTLDQPDRAGRNYAKTLEFYRTAVRAATYRDLYECIEWCVSEWKSTVGGRNIAAVHDAWKERSDELGAELRANPDKFKLRRAGNSDRGSTKGDGHER